MTTELVYSGRGVRPAPSGPVLYDETLLLDTPAEGYLADQALVDAVNTAIYLKQPLLVMGEPGSGKTQLAHSIAWEFNLPLQKFSTKMNSAGIDLFYRYDSLLHFHDTNVLKQPQSPNKYVQYAGLGRAILFSNPPASVAPYLPEPLRATHQQATRSVVLVDEIDKAPRDFPNDILAETEELAFEVRETGWPRLAADRNLTPILVFTSNQERNLPEAFLRRCVFYYISFPNETDLGEIVRRRLTGEHDAAIRRFLDIRSDDQLVKKPATAELLAWLRLLKWKGVTPAEIRSNSDRVRRSYSVLLKAKEDLARYATPEKTIAVRTTAPT